MTLRRVLADCRGIAAIEFAAALPVLIGLSLVAFEVSSYVLLNIKLQHAATTVAELSTRDERLCTATLDDLFSATPQIVAPFAFSSHGVVIVSGVAGNGTVGWQRSGGGSYGATSEIGAPGAAAGIPPDITVDASSTLVAAEVFYDYQPILLGTIPQATLHKAAYYRPRFGTLPSLC